MGSVCLAPVVTPYDSTTPNYASLNWQLIAHNGYYGVFGSAGGNTYLLSTAIVAGQQAVESLNPKKYVDKSAFIFQLANNAEIKKYFEVELNTGGLNRNFIIAANYPFYYCCVVNSAKDGVISNFYDIHPIEYDGKYYFMGFLPSVVVSGNPRYADNGAFANLYDAYYSLADFFRENPWIRPVTGISWFAHDEYLGANCPKAYGHKIGLYGEPYYSPYSPSYFASGTPATMKIIPSEGYSIAKPGHLKVFNDGVEIPYTQDVENGLINFIAP